MPDDFDESISTLGTATAGVPASGNIETSFDRDWFAVTLVYGRVYRFELRGAETSDGTLLDPYIPGLFDSDGNALSGIFADENLGTLNHEFVYVPYYGGLYYVPASANGGGTGTYTLEFVDLEGNILATGLDDLIVGTEFADALNGLAGDDIIHGLEGNDWLEGGDGNDTISGGLGLDNLFGGEGDDRLEDSHPDNIFLNPAFPDSLYGGNGNDTLNGSNAFLYGEAGDDVLSGGFYLDGGTGADQMFDARGGSTIYIVDNVGDFVAEYLYDSYGPGNTATGDVDEIRSSIDWALRDWNDDGFNVENLTLLGSADLSASGNEVANVITGNSGNNHLDGGSAGDDTLYGFGGDDTITGGTGNDLMSGGEGADVFVFAPGDGNDSITDYVGETDILDLTAFGEQVTFIETKNDAGERVFTVNGDVTITLTVVLSDDYLPGDLADILGSIAVDVPETGSIESDGDRDRFQITLEAGQIYSIGMTSTLTQSGILDDPEIFGVFNSLNTLVAGSSDNDSGGGLDALLDQLIVETSGVYEIEVGSHTTSGIGGYELLVESLGAADDFLPGHSGGFGSVSIGGRTSGEIETSGDIDGFRVNLQANTTYEISILGQDSNNGTLLDPDLLGVFTTSDLSGTPTTSVQTLNTQFVGDDSTSYFTPQAAGDFFIGVRDAFGGVGTYTVAVDDIGVRDDFSADIDTTGSIAPGGSAVGRVDFAQDNDWFEVNLSANRLYEIELVPSAGGNALADPFFHGVYNSNGELIANTTNDDGGDGTSSALQFVTDVSGTFYLAAGGFGTGTGQYRLALNDVGVLDDDKFNITIEFVSDNVPSDYIQAFEDAAERWEEIIIGDLPNAFVEGYGYVDDILIEVAVENVELTFEGVEQTILALSTVLDQRNDSPSGSGALPTYSRIVINPDEVGEVLNLDELVANTIGRALGFGSLWEEFGLVRDIDGVATYTGPNGLREMRDLSRDLNGVNTLEDGDNGSLAAEYWSEDVFGFELMTSLVALRTPSDGQAPFGQPDNPISALTIAAMQDLGYQVDYSAADRYRLKAGALDGYLSGAKIYVDTNGDGIPDPDEDTGITTDAEGFFSLNQADGVVSGATLVVGGTNIDTGLPNELILSAPQGSYIVSPITSLIQRVNHAEGGSVDDAAAKIEAALGITADIDLLIYDPLSQEPDDAVAVSTQSLAAQLAVLATVIGDGETFDDIVAYLLANPSEVIDLADVSQLQAMLLDISGEVLSRIANINQALAGAGSLTDITQIQGGALDDENDAPWLNGVVADQDADYDSPFELSLPAGLFIELDAGDTLTVSASLDDDSPLPSWLTFNSQTLQFTGTPVAADGGDINIKITATDSFSAVTSTAFTLMVKPPGLENNDPQGDLLLYGNAFVGASLLAEPRAISDADGLGTFGYQWYRDGEAMAGATSQQYQLTGNDNGHLVGATVTYTDGAGYLEIVSGESRLVTETTSPSYTDLIEMYVIILGRAPAQGGLNFWGGLINDGKDFEYIASEMWNSAGAREFYPSDMTTEEVVTSVYLNILVREPKESGLNYWVGQWEENGPVDTMLEMINALTANNSSNPLAIADKELFQSKVDVGGYLANTVGNTDVDLASASFTFLEAGHSVEETKTFIDDEMGIIGQAQMPANEDMFA